MLYLVDKSTGFYHVERHAAFIEENEEDIDRRLRQDPNITVEFFDLEDEVTILNDMLNQGIRAIVQGNKRWRIELEDIEYVRPNYMELFMSRLKLGDEGYRSMLWSEKAYFITNIESEEPKYLVTTIEGKKYYVGFASKMAADEFIRRSPDYKNFKAILFPLDKKYRFCLVGNGQNVFLEDEDNVLNKDIPDRLKKYKRSIENVS